MTPKLTEIPLSSIVFDEGLYPRVEGHNPETVQTYVRDMESIEDASKFISVNADNILIDGRHRMLAYRKINESRGDLLVRVFQYPISSPLETYKLAHELQDKGRSLTTEDRINGVKKLYALGMSSQAEIARSIGVSQPTVSSWLSRTLKDEKERKQKQVFSLWLACYTQEEISEYVNVLRRTVTNWIEDFGKISDDNILPNLSKNDQATASHLTDFEPPIYNIWKQQKKSPGISHFGNSEVRWLDNLLYLYTNPFDIVVDPFAGGGSTIDICKKRFRRYWVSDRKPIIERETEIRMHDLVDGVPQLPRWKDVRLVYLDPPYWKQAEGEYSNDPSDLANMSLDDFNKTLSGIINAFAGKIKGGEQPSYIALIIQPTQWKAEDRQFTDHVGDMLRLIKLPVDMRFSVPYETQQYTPQMVDWAKETRRCLVLTREIVVWRV